MKENAWALSQRQVAVILTCIIVLGAALRLYRINYQSLWYDELHSIIASDPESNIASIVSYCESDQPPTSFLYLHYFFKAFGYSDLTGRVACALIGIFAIPVFYLLGKECHSKAAGLFASVVVAVNYFHIVYSQELRFYSMLFLLTALSYLFFIRAFRYGRLNDFGLYGISTIALLYTHYFGLVVYGVQAITFLVLVLLYKKDTRFIVFGVISGILIGISFLPWIPVIMKDLGISSFWIQKPKPGFVLDYFYTYFGKDIISTAAFAVFIGLFVKSLIKREHTSEEKGIRMILMLWLVLSYLVPYVKSVTGLPVLHIRYTLITLPAWFILFAMGWDEIKSIKWKYYLVVILALAAVINLIFVRKHYSVIQKQQFREATQLVKESNAAAGFPAYSAFPWHFNFYFRDADQKVMTTYQAVPPESDGLWLLQVDFTSPEEKEQEIQKFAPAFSVAERHTFHKVDVVLMRRNH